MSARVIGDEESGCVWLYDFDLDEQVAALWPSGWHARFHPLRIYERTGSEVAREGEELIFDGGPSSFNLGRLQQDCRVGDRAWWVANVRDRG